MTLILPPKRPQQLREDTIRIIETSGVFDKVALVGIRGYYRDTLGVPGVNDRNIYDDALFLISPEAYITYNANTDPSIVRPRVASLKQGVWYFKRGKHKGQYDALRQAEPVTVIRDEVGEDTGWFGINIHKGSRTTTSSLGCITIWPEQWPAFIITVYSELKRYSQSLIPLVLVEHV